MAAWRDATPWPRAPAVPAPSASPADERAERSCSGTSAPRPRGGSDRSGADAVRSTGVAASSSARGAGSSWLWPSSPLSSAASLTCGAPDARLSLPSAGPAPSSSSSTVTSATASRPPSPSLCAPFPSSSATAAAPSSPTVDTALPLSSPSASDATSCSAVELAARSISVYEGAARLPDRDSRRAARGVPLAASPRGGEVLEAAPRPTPVPPSPERRGVPGAADRRIRDPGERGAAGPGRADTDGRRAEGGPLLVAACPLARRPSPMRCCSCLTAARRRLISASRALPAAMASSRSFTASSRSRVALRSCCTWPWLSSVARASASLASCILRRGATVTGEGVGERGGGERGGGEMRSLFLQALIGTPRVLQVLSERVPRVVVHTSLLQEGCE